MVKRLININFHKQLPVFQVAELSPLLPQASPLQVEAEEAHFFGTYHNMLPK